MRSHCLLLSACFACLISCIPRAREGKAEKVTQKPEKIVLTVLAGQSTSDAGIEEMIDGVLAQRAEDIELDWERVGWGGQFQSQMHAKIAAGDIPDIMIGKAQDVTIYAPAGVLAPLSPLLASKISADALPEVTRDGKVFGLPYNAFYQGVFYDKDLFNRLGITPPRTEGELADLVRLFKSKGIVPFATHFAEAWYLGNILMQFALEEIFPTTPDWGDRFREGKVNFATSSALERCIQKAKYVYENSWADVAAVTKEECDERFANGEAALYLSGSWILQPMEVANPVCHIGVFPYPSREGGAKLVYEPNMTFMKSAVTERGDAVDRVFDIILSDDDLAYRIFAFTKTSSLLRDRSTEIPLLIQGDVDAYRQAGRLVDATVGNGQIIWSFQQYFAEHLMGWLRGSATLDSVLKEADERRSSSAP